MFDEFGINAGYVEELHTRWLQSPQSVEEGWRRFFEGTDAAPTSSGSAPTPAKNGNAPHSNGNGANGNGAANGNGNGANGNGAAVAAAAAAAITAPTKYRRQGKDLLERSLIGCSSGGGYRRLPTWPPTRPTCSIPVSARSTSNQW